MSQERREERGARSGERRLEMVCLSSVRVGLNMSSHVIQKIRPCRRELKTSGWWNEQG